MICKSCGNNVKSDFKFCPYCGGRVAGDFHDHYGDLQPPYIMDDDDDFLNSNADFYEGTLEESVPDFERDQWDRLNDFQDFVGDEEDVPYFVYHPQGSSANNNEQQQTQTDGSTKSIKPKREKKTPSLAVKILLITITLLLAFGAAYGIYMGLQML